RTPRMPDWLDGCAGPARFGEDSIRESGPGLLRPVTEAPVRQTPACQARIRVDPEEAAALPEVAEGAREVSFAGPVRPLLVPELEAQPPVVRLHAAEAGQHAGEAREGDRGRFRQRLRRDQPRRQEFAPEGEQVAERAGDAGGRRAVQRGAQPERLE